MSPVVEQVRDVKAYLASMKNFHGWLGDVVPGASDIDFICERNGNFLVIELKHYFRGIDVPYGQHLLLWRLSEQPNTRLYLAGEDKDGETIHLMEYRSDVPPKFVKKGGKTFARWTPRHFIPSDKDRVRHLVESWWEDAGG